MCNFLYYIYFSLYFFYNCIYNYPEQVLKQKSDNKCASVLEISYGVEKYNSQK